MIELKHELANEQLLVPAEEILSARGLKHEWSRVRNGIEYSEESRPMWQLSNAIWSEVRAYAAI